MLFVMFDHEEILMEEVVDMDDVIYRGVGYANEGEPNSCEVYQDENGVFYYAYEGFIVI